METNDQAPIPSSSVISETTPKQVIPGIYSKTMPNGEKREARVWLVLAEGEVNFIYTVYQPVESSHTLVTPNPPLVVSWIDHAKLGICRLKVLPLRQHIKFIIINGEENHVFILIMKLSSLKIHDMNQYNLPLCKLFTMLGIPLIMPTKVHLPHLQWIKMNLSNSIVTEY